MKHGTETLHGLRSKLHMMGTELTGPTYVYGDNMSVLYNTFRPESTLKKKSNSLCYHAVREVVASGECLTSHIPTLKHPSDLLTKVLYGNKCQYLVSSVIFNLYDDFD